MHPATVHHMVMELLKLDKVVSVEVDDTSEKFGLIIKTNDPNYRKDLIFRIYRIVNMSIPRGTELKITINLTLIAKLSRRFKKFTRR